MSLLHEMASITSSTGVQLPDQTPPDILSDPELLDGYRIVEQFEASERVKPATKEQKERLMYIRILAYLILQGPSHQACVAVARRIVQLSNDDDILAEGKMFLNHYICAFYRFRRSAPPESMHSTRLYKDLEDMFDHVLVQTPQNHSEAKNNALLRDSFLCRVSGTYDRKIEELTNWQDIVGLDFEIVSTECVHILPESMNASNAGRVEQAANVWTICSIFGYGDLYHELNGTGFHRSENILTLEHNVYDEFDRLNLWFEATNTPGIYDVRGAFQYTVRRRWNRQVQFTSSQGDLPLPSPDYLALHAACCRVAHMSGAANYIDQLDRELEYLKVLSRDGASADLLTYALL